MKRFITVFVLLSLLSIQIMQSANVDTVSVYSASMNKEIKTVVVLPDDYQNNENLSVLYLLHGYSDDETGWIQFGEANLIADRGIAAGDFPPCIIVMPDGKVT